MLKPMRKQLSETMSKPLAAFAALAVVLLLSTPPCAYASMLLYGEKPLVSVKHLVYTIGSTTYHVYVSPNPKMQVLKTPAAEPWIEDFIDRLDKASRKAAVIFGASPFTEVYVVDPSLDRSWVEIPANAVVVKLVPNFRMHEAIEDLMRAYARRYVAVDDGISWFIEGACSYGAKRIASEELDNIFGLAKLYEDYLILERAYRKQGKEALKRLGGLRSEVLVATLDMKLRESTASYVTYEDLLNEVASKSQEGVLVDRGVFEDMLKDLAGLSYPQFFSKYIDGAEIPPKDACVYRYELIHEEYFDSLCNEFFDESRISYLVTLEYLSLTSQDPNQDLATMFDQGDETRYVRTLFAGEKELSQQKVVSVLTEATGVDCSDFFQHYSKLLQGSSPSELAKVSEGVVVRHPSIIESPVTKIGEERLNVWFEILDEGFGVDKAYLHYRGASGSWETAELLECGEKYTASVYVGAQSTVEFFASAVDHAGRSYFTRRYFATTTPIVIVF